MLLVPLAGDPKTQQEVEKGREKEGKGLTLVPAGLFLLGSARCDFLGVNWDSCGCKAWGRSSVKGFAGKLWG